MRRPQITITCDCGEVGHADLGERWRCDACGRTWDTAQIPSDDYERLLRGVRRYRLIVLGPPLLLAAILVPLTVLVGVQYAFLLFVLLMAHGLLVVPPVRRRATERILTMAPRWKLRPD